MTDIDVPHFWELDYIGDLKLFQHPPCLFILWWLGLGVNGICDLIDDLLNSEGGDGDKKSVKEKRSQAKQDQKPQNAEKITADTEEILNDEEDKQEPAEAEDETPVVTDAETDEEQA